VILTAERPLKEAKNILRLVPSTRKIIKAKCTVSGQSASIGKENNYVQDIFSSRSDVYGSFRSVGCYKAGSHDYSGTLLCWASILRNSVSILYRGITMASKQEELRSKFIDLLNAYYSLKQWRKRAPTEARLFINEALELLASTPQPPAIREKLLKAELDGLSYCRQANVSDIDIVNRISKLGYELNQLKAGFSPPDSAQAGTTELGNVLKEAQTLKSDYEVWQPPADRFLGASIKTYDLNLLDFIDNWYHEYTRHHLVDVDPEVFEHLIKPLTAHAAVGEELKDFVDNLTFGFPESEVKGMSFVKLNKYQKRDLYRAISKLAASYVPAALLDRVEREVIGPDNAAIYGDGMGTAYYAAIEAENKLKAQQRQKLSQIKEEL